VTARKHDASTRFWNLVQKYESVAPDTGDPDWNDPSSVLLRLPLSCSIVPGNPLDDAIALAFAKTAFDVRDPLQWKILLGLFCIAHFGSWQKPAAHKVWTPALLEKLDNDAAEIWSRHPDFSDEAVARALKGAEPYRDAYGGYSVSYLRERLTDARKSKQESEKLLNTLLALTRNLYAICGAEWRISQTRFFAGRTRGPDKPCDTAFASSRRHRTLPEVGPQPEGTHWPVRAEEEKAGSVSQPPAPRKSSPLS